MPKRTPHIEPTHDKLSPLPSASSRGRSGATSRLAKSLRGAFVATLALVVFGHSRPAPAGAGGDSGYIDPDNYGVPKPFPVDPLVYPTDSVVPTTAPIALPGTSAVTDSGDMTYTIPLRVRDGPGGMKPHLSLVYGGAGNGRLGAGWGLSGDC